MAPVIRGNSLYAVVNSNTWTSAKNEAKQLGGDLVTINNREEDFLVQSIFGPSAPLSGGANWGYWMGLYRDSSSSGYSWSDWKWISGQATTYQNDYFKPGETGYEPNGGYSDSPYGMVWGDQHYPGGIPAWNDIQNNGNAGQSPQIGIAEIPLTSSITFSSAPKEGAGAFTTSINLSAGTQATGNLAEGAPVWWKVSGINADDLVSGDLAGTGTITNGKLDIQHSLKADADTGEMFEVSVFSDSDRTQSIGSMSSFMVQEYTHTTAQISKISEAIKNILISDYQLNLSTLESCVINASIIVDERVTGLTRITAQWSASIGNARVFANFIPAGYDNVGNQIFEGTLRFGGYYSSGNWTLSAMSLVNDNTGTSILGSGTHGFPDASIKTSINVVNPNGDNILPLVSSLELKQNPAKIGEFGEIIVKVGFQDEGSGLSSIGMQIAPRGANSKFFGSVSSESLVNGVATFVLDETTLRNYGIDIVDRKAEALWDILEISAYDNGGNFRVYYNWNGDLKNLGYQTEHLFQASSFKSLENNINLSIVFSGKPKEGAGVFTTSINLSAGTQSTGNLAEGAPVWWKVSGINADDLVSGDLAGTGTITNGKLDIQHSLKADADTGEMFEVSVYSDEDRTQQVGTTTSAAVLEGPVVRGNSLYTIVDGPSWTQAEANSVKLGGHLVSISSDSENKFLVDKYAEDSAAYNGDVSYYLGLTDKASKGNWVWSDGSSLSYSNWSPGEPQQSNGEDYSEFLLVSTGPRTPGQWGDNFETIGSGKGIAETPFIRRGDSAYVIVQGPTWEEAEANAVKLGGHLVTINDAAENEWISDTFRDRLAAPDKNWNNGLRAGSWIGLNDKAVDGVPKWADGTEVRYTNYMTPSNAIGTSGVFDGWLSVMLDPSGSAQRHGGLNSWHEGSATTLPDYTVYTTGIAEIKLAPNNTATGIPTLSGTLKAGQTITIDKTPVQDADNFAGFTPTYNYSFEFSNDNGTNWTKLTSTDATDNNTTYTLTTAEVGKKVRGVVSYLDGYGTNESVASAASSNVIAPSNTAPTAVQTLTGSSKVGRVLTADKSTIIDPDGVPTAVSYGWEVSTNGTTWTKLTTADATDNNSTYALTAAELGKTVRSIISFTDQLGTNETVSSAPTSVVLAGAKPTGISLSKSTFAENVGPNVSVAKLSSVDLDTDDAYTYSLVSGTGSTDNSRFSIAADQLVITSNPDFETKNSYSIRVRTTDLGGLSVDKSFTLKVTNVNEAPIAISLSDSDFLENIAAGSVIGTLGSIDPDRDTTFTYSLTPNSPQLTSTDNQFFSIVNDQLKINASANFEQKDSYTVSVRSTDAGKLFYDQVFTLVVQDVDEAPTDISITGTGIDEGAAVGSLVGSLVSTDQDESSSDFTYELVAGNKPNNNDQFEIIGGQLKAKSTFNFETKSSYVVNVRTTDDAGLTFTKSITIRVNNVNENPTDLTVSATAFNENLVIGTTVATLGVLDPDKGDTYSYSFVTGEGDKDNQAFLIAGNALKVNIPTNFEVQKSYAVRLRVTDQGGLFFDKSVVLGVNNLVEKVTSGVSTTLALDKDTLELTGSKNIAGFGNQFDNTIVGNTGRNKLTGGMGKDILTGGTGIDTFFYNDLKESLLSGFDVITDYAVGEKISLALPLFEGDDLIVSTGKASAFTEGAIGSVLTNTTFVANNAAAFTVEGLRGTFLALNDGRDGFQADTDALIHLSNYTIGSKTPISVI